MRKMQKESEKVYKKTIKRISERVQGKDKMLCTFFFPNLSDIVFWSRYVYY